MIALAVLLAAQLSAAATADAKNCTDDAFCFVVLAEKYAGKGDYASAEELLRRGESSLAQFEYEGMLEHLQKMKRGEEKARLDFCDYATSGYGATYCAHKRWDEAMPQLDARLERFATMRPVVNAFVEAEMTRIGEQSRGGTGYVAITLDAEVHAKQRVVEQLETYSKKRATGGEGDKELNAEYQKARNALDDAQMKILLRDAQRAWIAYRDAFAELYVTRWRGAAKPDVLRSEIVAQLSRDRAAELRE